MVTQNTVSKKTYTGAQIIVQTLKNLGVDTIFGYPGGVVLSIYDELFKQNDIKHYYYFSYMINIYMINHINR